MLAVSNEYRDVFIPYWEHLEVYQTLIYPSLIVGLLTLAGMLYYLPSIIKSIQERKFSRIMTALSVLTVIFVTIFLTSAINYFQGFSKMSEAQENRTYNIMQKYGGKATRLPWQLPTTNSVVKNGSISDLYELPSEVLSHDNEYTIYFADKDGNASGVYNVRFDPNTSEPFISGSGKSTPTVEELEEYAKKHQG